MFAREYANTGCTQALCTRAASTPASMCRVRSGTPSSSRHV